MISTQKHKRDCHISFILVFKMVNIFMLPFESTEVGDKGHGNSDFKRKNGF